MKKELCKNCQYYSAYYKRWSSHFGKLSIGMCRKQNQQKKQFDVCEQYKDNTEYLQEKDRTTLAKLQDALLAIEQIALILKERQSD